MHRAPFAAVVAAAAFALPAAAQSLAPPPDWIAITESPARNEPSQSMSGLPDSVYRFVMMPPGYHVTTGPGMLLYHPAYRADSIFTVEAEVFLFPGSSDEEYGVFLGGADLGSADGRRYTAFVLRRDGSAAVLRRSGAAVTPLVAWARHDSIAPHTGSGVVKNVLRVAAERGNVVFTVNGAEVARVPRDSVAANGHFGYRVGRGVNLHATTLDLTLRLAPPRPPR